MSLLRLRDISHMRTDWAEAIRDAGGLWGPAAPTIKMREVLAEASDRDIRALSLSETPDDLPDRLPDLEFLSGTTVGAVTVARLSNLRYLSVENIAGPLDFRELPRMEWLSISECTPRNLDGLLDGHPTLRDLSVDKYPFTDLRPLRALRLAMLSATGGRLASLTGIDAFAGRLRRLNTGWAKLPSIAEIGGVSDSLVKLSVDRCSGLLSLDGIEALSGLEALVLADLRHVTRLDIVTRLPNLRLLAIADLKNVESLAPIAGHPALEFVDVGMPKDGDLDPIATLPRLRLVNGPRRGWSRDLATLPYFHNYDPRDEPAKEEFRRLMHF